MQSLPPHDTRRAIYTTPTQVETLETALGGLQHIYHESLTVGGEEGLEQLSAADQRG